jgi:succinylglutamate desuccinylase
MLEEIVEIKGKQKGPTSIIIAGIHGNEDCGPKAFQKILPKLKIEKGRIFFIYGNPLALRNKKRFIDYDLNRLFKNARTLSKQEKTSYEYQRALLIKKCLRKATALLDIHASQTRGSQPFIICEPKSYKLATYLPANIIISGFDKFEPGGTDYFMNRLGKKGICLECGYAGAMGATKIAESGIMAFLKALNHLPNKTASTNKQLYKISSLYRTKTKKFQLTREFRDFEIIEAGQTIGLDGSEKIIAHQKCSILFARNRKMIGAEAFILIKTASR